MQQTRTKRIQVQLDGESKNWNFIILINAIYTNQNLSLKKMHWNFEIQTISKS